MKPRISIITLGVKDLNRAIHFYRDGLNLPMREQRGDIAFCELQGTWLALYPLAKLLKDIGREALLQNPGFSGITLAHNLSSKDEVDRLKRQGQLFQNLLKMLFGALIRAILRILMVILLGGCLESLFRN